ncbi:MAG: outer membrane protein assembly factor BamD [Chromatiales bacterium]|nr:outer membrane protein assembly factor BamD [Chromatiales bacterium]
MAIIRSLILLLALATLSACSLLPEQIDETKGWSAQKFYNEASAAMADGDYQTAIKYYESLEARYPFGRYAMQAQLDVAYAYYKDGDNESAIAAADRFIKLHPRNRFVDYAYYLKGVVNFNRNLGFLARFFPTDASQRDASATLSSFNDFSELVNRFPNSEYAPDARKRMIYLRNNLAMNELHVARYYMKRGSYIAAANRAKTIVEKYQRTPAVKEALEIMVEAYNILELPELSADAQRVLAMNEQRGAFDIPANDADEGPSLGRKIWDYFKMDEN